MTKGNIVTAFASVFYSKKMSIVLINLSLVSIFTTFTKSF